MIPKSAKVFPMNKFLIPLSVLLVALILSIVRPSGAAELSCQKLSPISGGTIDGIEMSYKKINSLEASFVQSSFFTTLEKAELSKGQVRFLKPGKMDWTYTEPDAQRFVSDGKVISFYQPKLNQVTLNDFTNSFSSNVPVTFLLGIGSLKESFNASGSCKTEDGLLVEFTPKNDASLSKFFLLVDEKGLTPKGAKVIDVGGNETAITLLSPKLNASFSGSQFVFEIPKGVDIIDNRSGRAEAALPVTEENLVK